MRVVRRAPKPKHQTVSVRELMARSVVTIDPRDSLIAAAAQMRTSRVGSLIVLAGAEISGIFTERDLLRAIADGRDPATTHVSQYMTQNPRTIEADPDQHRAIG